MLLSGAGVFMKRRAATWGRPYGSTRVHLNPGRAGHGPAPTADTETIPFFRRGRSQTGPLVHGSISEMWREGQAPPLQLYRVSP